MNLIAYALAALCLIWWLLALAITRIAVVTRRLEDLPLVEREAWPSVAVIAPAKDEAAGLEDALRSRLRSDYPSLRIVVVDDRSQDDTGLIADRLAASDPRVQAVHVTELPSDWLGKLNALQRGVDATDADWLLFSDADVHVAPGTLRRAIHHAEEHGIDLLTAMPHVLPGGLGVNSIHAVFLTFLAPAFDAPRAENPKSSFAPAVGAFSLVRRSALAKTPGFASIRLCVDDDLQLGLMLKASGARCSVFLGPGSVSVDMYPTVRDMIVGAEKNAWGVASAFSAARGLVLCAFLPVFEFAPWLLLAVAPTPGLRLYAALSGLSLLGASSGAMLLNGRNPWPVLVQPVGVLILTWAMFRGTLKGWRQGGLSWRGTHYPTERFLRFQAGRKAG